MSKDVSVADDLKRLHKQFADRPELAEYPIAASISTLQRASADFEIEKTNIHKWKLVLDFAAERTKLFSLKDQFLEAVQTCLSYKQCILNVQNEAKDSGLAMKVTWKRHREKFSALFLSKKSGISNAVARVCGDHLYDRISDASKVGITIGIGGNRLAKEPESIANFATPMLLFKVEDAAAEVTHYHKECAKFISASQSAIDAKIKTMQAELVSNALKPAATLASIECQSTFNWNADAEKPIFNCPGDIRTPVSTVENGRADIRLVRLPYRLNAKFFHVIEGDFILILLDTDSLAHATELETYLDGLNAGEIPKNSSYMVHAGESVWCPFGHVIIPVAVPKNGILPVDSGAKDWRTHIIFKHVLLIIIKINNFY